MYRTQDRIYFYHAYALAAGGYVESDGERQNVDSAGSTVLSIAGGSGHARHSDYLFYRYGTNGGDNFYVRIDEVRSEVVGYEHAGGYTTRAKTVLHGLDINGVVTANVVESIVESHHSTRACEEREEATIGVLTSHFEGLRVNDHAVEPQRNPVFERFQTFAHLRQLIDGTYVGDRETDEMRVSLRRASFFDLPEEIRPDDPDTQYVRDLHDHYVRDDAIRCSIFRPLGAIDGLQTHGSSIHVPTFGRIFLGELVVTHGMKRLNMVRCDLGCTIGGSLTGGGSSVNGETMP